MLSGRSNCKRNASFLYPLLLPLMLVALAAETANANVGEQETAAHLGSVGKDESGAAFPGCFESLGIPVELN